MAINNQIDYSYILDKLPNIYPFTLYTPGFKMNLTDVNDGWLDPMFYNMTGQFARGVDPEVSNMNREKLSLFMKEHVPDNGFITEIGVWRDPNSTFITSTKLFLDTKSDNTTYLGIDIADRPHIIGIKPNLYFLKTDSANIPLITNYINNNITKQIDFLFIDGLHTVEQVGKELALINLVRKGGIIGFHDIAAHTGPNMWINAFNPDMFDIHKFYNANDWGIGFIVKKF